MLHSLGIGADAQDDAEARRIAAQDAAFDALLTQRQCLPIDLLRIGRKDLAAALGFKTGNWEMSALSESLGRYVNSKWAR